MVTHEATIAGVVAALVLLCQRGAHRATVALLAAATGMPEVLLPITPAIPISTAAGALAARGLFGTTVQTGGTMISADGSVVPATVVEVPVPWVELGIVAGLALTLTVLFTLAVMPLLTRAVDATELRTT